MHPCQARAGQLGQTARMSKTPTSKITRYTVRVEFGDCDPAGIVFFPNYSRWMDAATHEHFRQCGVPAWHDIPELPGCVGGPLLETHTHFHTSATYGQTLEVQTQVTEWRGKVFRMAHRILRDGTLVCEGKELRALCVKLPDGRLKAVDIPDFLRERCA